MPANQLTLEAVDGPDALAREWDELADRTSATPFVRPGWIRAWWSAFGRGRPLILAARRKGDLVALVPLERRRGTLRSPTNAHTPLFDLLAADQQALEMLAGAVFSQGSRTVALDFLVRSGGAFEALRTAARAAGYRDVVRPTARLPYVTGRTSLAAHERSLSRNLRHDVERRLRRLCDVGAVSVQVCDGTERLDDLLAEGFRVEQLGWKGRHGTAISSRPVTQRFYADIARWAASRGSLRLAFLRLDDDPIAFQLDLESAGMYYSLKVGYDPAYERFSPGKLLAYNMVSRAVSRGLQSYELLGTDEAWKHRWTDTFRDCVALHAFASSSTGYVAWAAFVHGRSFARRVPFASRAAAALRP